MMHTAEVQRRLVKKSSVLSCRYSYENDKSFDILCDCLELVQIINSQQHFSTQYLRWVFQQLHPFLLFVMPEKLRDSAGVYEQGNWRLSTP